MGDNQKIIYYKDELNDEFAGDNITARVIDGSYKYIRDSICGKFLHLLFYRIIAIPIAWCYMKIYFGHRVINKKKLKIYKTKGYFMYGNHTHFIADALVPTMVNMPKCTDVIVHPNNVSMPVLGRVTPYLGALPLPDDVHAAKNFINAVSAKIKKKDCVMIYPEAHIWPYYTDIRPFKDDSFRYPVKLNVPVFCITNTYQKRKYLNRVKMVTYIDGPFYADKDKSAKEQRSELRNQVYTTMKKRSNANNVTKIKYVKCEN